MKLPDLVRVCKVCNGDGQYEQTYNAGCGFGLYRSMGRCDFCRGQGYVYLNGEPIPISVTNQIKVMNGLEIK
jgi:DnaJ-class molecular chaperone